MGSEQNPVIVEWEWDEEYANAAASVAVGAGETVYYNGNSGMILTVDGVETAQTENGVFSITNAGDAEATYALALATPVGAYNNPEVIENIADFSDTNSLAEDESYYYIWTAEENTTVILNVTEGANITVDQLTYTEGNEWPVSVQHVLAEPEIDENWNYTGWVVAEKLTIDVIAGQELKIQVNALTDWSTWTTPAIDYTLTAETFTKDEYAISEEVVLDMGENTLSLSENAYTTIYEFIPDETGIYVFEVVDDSGAVLGYWGAGTFYVWDQTETKTATLQKEVTSVGPSIMVGVTGSGEVTLNVTKSTDEMETQPEVEVTYYETTSILSDYSLTLGENQELVNVDVTSGDVYSAVLGSDGFYHLNSEDGPVLLVNLGTNSYASLSVIVGTASISVYEYDEGDPVAKTDYTQCVSEYAAVMSEDGLYPLTADLMTIYQEYGAQQGWYDADTQYGFYLFGEAEVDPETAWMFACCYVETTENEGTEPAAAAVMTLAGQRRAGYLL